MVGFQRSLAILVALTVYVLGKPNNLRSCGPGMSTPGYTYPNGDITLEAGQDLTIYCVLRDVQIHNNSVEDPSKFMTMKYLTNVIPTEIVNATTIKLHIKNHPVTAETDYSCMYYNTFLCHNVVIVGTKPKNVTDFDCVGYNYENFTCSWTAPQNYVATNYSLNYKPVMRGSRYKSKSSKKTDTTSNIDCPVIKAKGDKLSCTWSFSTIQQYRHVHEYFAFNLTANNTFGTMTLNTTLNHFSRIIPNPPENLTANATSTSSIQLRWTIPVHMRAFHGGLEHKVSYWMKDRQWTTLKTIQTNRKMADSPITYTITNLPYAYYLYDIRVRIRSRNATDEKYWSRNSSVAIRTLPKLPDQPPKTDIGSFEILEGREMIIYWERIKSYQENGQNFTYYIEVDGYPNIKPSKLSSNYAKFEKMDDRNYTFKIWSKNDIGKSEKYSVVFVPSTRYILSQPENFLKVDRGDGKYELEWSPSRDKVTNYTIFSCSDLRDRPYQCDGTLHWYTVPSSVTHYTLKFDEKETNTDPKQNHQLAISANGQISSGMFWAECTIIPGRGVKLRQVYVKDVRSRSMTVMWKLDCFKKDDLLGFNITYCPTIPYAQSPDCRYGSTRSINITDSRAEAGVITDLTPYTRYKIQVKPILNGSEGQFSEAVFNSTFEGKPTEPKDLRAANITTDSITVEWQKPEQENGFIRYYNVNFDGKSMKVPSEKNKDRYTYTLTNLNASTDYVVKVEACTLNCSEALIETATELGRPNMVHEPSAYWSGTTIVLRWDKPLPLNAKINHFQVWISTEKDEDSRKHTIENVTRLTFNLTTCRDEKVENVYVKVRAVNVLGNTVLAGPWSGLTEFPCHGRADTRTWVIVVIVVGALAFFGITAYLAKKLWTHILKMRNVGVKLPDGLAAVVENYQEKEKNSGEPLLSKAFSSQSRNLSGESSGCCSANESVASSIESNGNLSTDSGTEQPRSPSLGEKDGRDASLRQRVTKPNIKKAEYVTMPELPATAWSNKQGPGYSVIGLMPPAKKSDENPDYMVLSDIPSKSPYVPYIANTPSETSTEAPMRPSTTGYVPYMAQEPAPRNTDYVLAGTPMKNVMVPPIPFPRKEEPSSGYVKAPPTKEGMTPMMFTRQPQIPYEAPSSGYVVVGDPKPQPADVDLQASSKAYVPHNMKFQPTKLLKED